VGHAGRSRSRQPARHRRRPGCLQDQLLAAARGQPGLRRARHHRDPVRRPGCGTARPAELRDTLHLPAQTITSVLDQLQAAGLVTRSPHPSDRRSTIAELTPAGHRAIDRICPPLIDIETDCMSALSQAEQDQLIALLTRIQDRIAQRRRSPATPAT
jgi:DNA-binding MarR family transcriptional regulator